MRALARAAPPRVPPRGTRRKPPLTPHPNFRLPSPLFALASPTLPTANVAFAFFLMMGSVGFYSSWFFVRYIYSSIKTD